MATIGVDIGGTKLAGVLLDDDGRVLEEIWLNHRVAVEQNAVDVIANGIDDLLARAAGQGLRVNGVGVSIAGWLDVTRETVVSAANLALTGSDLRAMLECRHRVPVRIGNDGDCTLLGEVVAGAGASARNAVLLTFGTGVGGGILLDGRLPVGSRGIAGELGHVPILSGADLAACPRCVCGGRGCLEQLTSGVALGVIATRLRDQGRSPWLSSRDKPVSARELGEAARAGCPESVAAVDRAATAIAAAIRILMPIVNPEVVILGGSVIEGLGDLVLPVVTRHLTDEPRPVATLYPAPSVVPATIHRNAAAIGAARLFTFEVNLAGHTRSSESNRSETRPNNAPRFQQ